MSNCKMCPTILEAPEQQLCSISCLDQFYSEQKILLEGNHCLVCNISIPTFNKKGEKQLLCGSPVCSGKFFAQKKPKVHRPCVHCDVDVLVLASVRPESVRCEKHAAMWPEIHKESQRQLRKKTQAEAPYNSYFLTGPYWDFKNRDHMVTLVHMSHNDTQKIPYARYLLSCKKQKRLPGSTIIIYRDGDRTNLDLENLAIA